MLLDAVDGVDSVTERGIGSQVEREGNDGKLALVIQRQSRGVGLKTREGAEGNLQAVGGFYIGAREGIGSLLELGIDFHDDVVLVELREDSADLALAESVVKGFGNIRGEKAERRGGGAV